jgi:hypothetical protein
MRAIDLAVSRLLPEDLRRDTYTLDKKGVSELLGEVARKHPEKFAEVAKGLGDLGRNSVWLRGYTSAAEDTRQVIDTSKYYAQMDAELGELRRQGLPPDEFDERRAELLTRYSDLIEKETMSAAMGNRNAFALAASSGARGNASHIKAILSTPGVYQDARGRVIPLFVRNSFGDGVRPAETLAGTYGARSSVVSTKTATAKGGDLLKIMTQSALNYNVTEQDCGVRNGIALEPDDPSLSGRVLALDAGDAPAGTVVDRQLLSRLRRSGKKVVARSAMTCRAKHGLCSRCVGVGTDGDFHQVGDSVGVTAAAALGEPIVQGSLNCLAEGTLVRMADYSVRRIEAVSAGDWVLGADIRGNTFPVKVLASHDQGMQPTQTYTYKATAKSRASVTCTADHPILQVTEYWGAKEEVFNRTARKLPAGRKAGRPSAVFPKDHTPAGDLANEPLAGVVGYFMGDGIRAYTDVSAVMVSCACAATISSLRALVRPHGMHIKKAKRSHDWRISKVTCASGRSDLRQLISALGFDGKYAHEKTLPAAVWTWDQDSVAALVAGFVAADGSVYRNKSGDPGVSFASSAPIMLEGLKTLLAIRFGVHTGAITRTGKAGQGGRQNDLWQFTVNRRDQVIRLHDAIAAHVPGGKGRKLAEYIREAKPSKFERVPYYKAKRLDIKDAGVRRCWDLSVDHPDELFVLHNMLIVKNTKHTGGMARGKKSFSGLPYISQFVQVPEEFKDRAAVSEVDGMVEKVEPAPQGGTFVHVGGERHFVLPGFAVNVKPGDTVEAGDILSEGLASPADVVRLRGLGEGRMYYARRLAQMLDDSGSRPDPRNVEIMARAAVDNYVVDDPDEEDPWLPDDMVRESELLGSYRPPADTRELPAAKAVGSYLQSPALHYTVGTRITPKMANELSSVGIANVKVSAQAPNYHPEMRRLRVAAHDSGDWLASMGTSYLSKQLRGSLERGDDTDIRENHHYGPRLAFGADAGSGAFGENVGRTGKF